ncbi:hypothetical protein BTA51_11420 [Hahella sp. CCB-MM4]|uniref:hypothetical protein n=1 Tax=Hahella sp. (strain CCB-MM4) TaxID=1926491 RepID=UPI000B9BBFB1|nr:hypothetical protein [Hahella sp. CCB-MM4]OZG73099.1 hypothetical protein BTA51_11420 [Hahella sp. CCB-MM4]
MSKNIYKALREAEKRLEELLPEIEKRHKQGVKNSIDEPDGLKSGQPDDLEIRREVREQNRADT